jgi:tetratricopeptide (TPR) repeat protein
MNPLLRIPLLAMALTAMLLCAAQTDVLVEANKKYQAKDLEGARTMLDEAVKREDLSKSPEAWVLRGFVYKDIWKGMPAGAEADMVRDEAMNSLLVSNALDSAKEYSKSSLQAYDYLAKTIYNDAAKALNDMDSERAIQLYAKHKESVLRTDARHAFADRDIEFFNALGTVYTKRFNQDRQDTTWYQKAIEVYKEVLRLDSSNYGANYNLATLFYNRGVYNIQTLDAEKDIPSIEEIQKVSRRFFSLALPYMLKAHQMNPTRKETLIGLEGIHYSLQNTEESEKWRQLYEKQLAPDNGAPKDK